MIPVGFNEVNKVLQPPDGVDPDKCEPLQVLEVISNRGNKFIISCWKFTKEELEIVTKTGRIWLTVAHKDMPMVSLNAEIPFTTDYKESVDSEEQP